MNTKDVCRVLEINERPSIGILRHPCMDLSGVIEAALTEGKDDMEFVDWLEANFVGYELRTPIRPNCGDDWKLRYIKGQTAESERQKILSPELKLICFR